MNTHRLARSFRSFAPVVHHGHKEVRRDEHYSPAKLRRRYADDGKRMLVQLNRTAHYATIIVKMAVPICVTEHDIRSAVRTMIIGKVEEAAEVRLNPQCVKVVAARLHAPDKGLPLARIHRYLSNVISCQTVKAVVAIAQIEIV